MAEVTNTLASEAAKSAVCCLVREASYCYDFDTYIKDFRKAKDGLESTIKNVEARAKRANEKTENIGDHFNRQLVEAQAAVQDAKDHDDKVKTKSYCLGRCPNLICQYFLGRRAEKKTLLMKELDGKFDGCKQFAQLRSLRRMDTFEHFLNSKSADLAFK